MWMDPSGIGVDVENGVVRLSGKAERRSEAEILAGLAHGVEGVVAVESSLTFGFDDRHVKQSTEQHAD